MRISFIAQLRQFRQMDRAFLEEASDRLAGMIDIATLQAALVGYHARLEEITTKMAEIRKALGTRPVRQAKGSGGDIPTPFTKPRKKRHMSAAARKRIAAAQKKRWAAFHAKQV